MQRGFYKEVELICG